MLRRRIKHDKVGRERRREYLRQDSLVSSDTDPAPHSSLSSKTIPRLQRWGCVLKRDSGTKNY